MTSSLLIAFFCEIRSAGRAGEHLRDASLHDEEMWVVHVQLHAVEHVLHPAGLCCHPINEVLVPASYHQLRSNHPPLVSFQRSLQRSLNDS